MDLNVDHAVAIGGDGAAGKPQHCGLCRIDATTALADDDAAEIDRRPDREPSRGLVEYEQQLQRLGLGVLQRGSMVGK